MDLDKLIEKVRRESGTEIPRNDPVLVCALLTEAAVEAVITDAAAQLREAVAAAVADLATKAEMRQGGNRAIEHAKAEIIDGVSARIAQTAGGMLRTMTRTSYLWASAAAVGVALLALVTGCGIGFIWGSDSATRTYVHADTTMHAVAVEEGPKAVRDWDRLMRLNPIEPLLAGCTGVNLAVENGESGCHMWLRISSPAMRSRKAKKAEPAG